MFRDGGANVMTLPHLAQKGAPSGPKASQLPHAIPTS